MTKISDKVVEKGLPFTIPEKPVDQYTVRYYRLSMCASWVYINEIKCVYHVNTPWGKYRPNWPGGTALVDDWLSSSDGSDEARICGWSKITEIGSSNVFATREEAIQESIRLLDKYVAVAEERIRAMILLRGSQVLASMIAPRVQG